MTPHIDDELPGQRSLYRLGGAAALLQLACVGAYVAISFGLGAEPTTVAEHFAVYGENRLAGLLRDDFTTLLLLGLYLISFPGLYLALRRLSPVYSALATVFTLIGVTLCFAGHSGVAMLTLSDQYAAATSDLQRAQLLAAGETVINSDMWHSSGGLMSGVLLQGSGVLISAIMLRSRDFAKLTAYAGIISNGLDLIQHLLHLSTPALAATILYAAGPFYLLWYAMLGRDFFRLCAH